MSAFPSPLLLSRPQDRPGEISCAGWLLTHIRLSRVRQQEKQINIPTPFLASSATDVVPLRILIFPPPLPFGPCAPLPLCTHAVIFPPTLGVLPCPSTLRSTPSHHLLPRSSNAPRSLFATPENDSVSSSPPPLPSTMVAILMVRPDVCHPGRPSISLSSMFAFVPLSFSFPGPYVSYDFSHRRARVDVSYCPREELIRLASDRSDS